MSLFRKIMSKNLNKEVQKRNPNFNKFADDIGGFAGILRWKKFDVFTGRFIEQKEIKNTITALSRSNMIRLMAQGNSPWLGEVDPSQLKISKMRFGNNNISMGEEEKILSYYDISEPSVRGNIPYFEENLGITKEINPAGGNPTLSNGELPGQDEADTVTHVYNINNPNDILSSGQSGKLFAIPSGTAPDYRPPSHGTFKVEIIDNPENENVLEELEFYTTFGDTTVYTRKSDGNNPKTINSSNTQTRISTPSSRNLSGYQGLTNTRLYYDYSEGNPGWKFFLEENDGIEGSYSIVRITYDKGRYNIINSIVPKNGYNAGTGTTVSQRYVNNSAGDYYTILSDKEYQDSPTTFADDVSVTFSANMPGVYGNGGDPTFTIKYTQAFLFNERNDLISILSLQGEDQIEKSQDTSYYISWTIVANV